jgi:hypothetical protein
MSGFSHAELKRQLGGRIKQLREKLQRTDLPESVVYSCNNQIDAANQLLQQLQPEK